MVSTKAKQGFMLMGVIAAVFTAVGALIGYRMAEHKQDSIDYIPGGTTAHFDPSDMAPEGVPAGTVCYEVMDVSANMRYWVFRFPDGQWAITPRFESDDIGKLYAYVVPSYEVGGAE